MDFWNVGTSSVISIAAPFMLTPFLATPFTFTPLATLAPFAGPPVVITAASTTLNLLSHGHIASYTSGNAR